MRILREKYGNSNQSKDKNQNDQNNNLNSNDPVFKLPEENTKTLEIIENHVEIPIPVVKVKLPILPINEILLGLYKNNNFYYLIKNLKLDNSKSISSHTYAFIEKLDCFLNTDQECFLNLSVNSIKILNSLNECLDLYTIFDLFEKYHNYSSNVNADQINLVLFLRQLFQNMNNVNIPLINDSKVKTSQAELNDAQMYWNKFENCFKLNLSFCDNKVPNLSMLKLNSTYLSILYDLYKLFSINLFKFKFNQSNWLRYVDYFNSGDQFFYCLIDKLEKMIILNYKNYKYVPFLIDKLL